MESKKQVCDIFAENLKEIQKIKKLTDLSFCGKVTEEGYELSETNLRRYKDRTVVKIPLELVAAVCNAFNSSFDSVLTKKIVASDMPDRVAKLNDNVKVETSEELKPPQDSERVSEDSETSGETVKRKNITGSTIKEFMGYLFEKDYIYDVIAQQSKFAPVLGTWEMYYISTHPSTKEKNNILHGTMNVYPAEAGYCCVSISIDTKKGYCKNYSGLMFGSLSTKTWYAFMKSDTDMDNKIAEFCTLVFGDITFNQQNDCIVGVANTSSAGTKRLPTAHRIMLTRKAIDEEHLLKFYSSLLMNTSNITFAQKEIEHIVIGEDENSKRLKEFFEEFIKRNPELTELVVSVEDSHLISAAKAKKIKLSDGTDFVDLLVRELIPELRKLSAEGKFTPRFNKVNNKVISYARAILNEEGYFDLEEIPADNSEISD